MSFWKNGTVFSVLLALPTGSRRVAAFLGPLEKCESRVEIGSYALHAPYVIIPLFRGRTTPPPRFCRDR